MSMSEQETWSECQSLLQGGFSRLVTLVDGIFVWGRAADDWQGSKFEQGVLEVAADLNRQYSEPIIIPGYCGAQVDQGPNGYPGPLVWQPALMDLGVQSEDVVLTAGGGTNTKTEFEDCLAVAQERQWHVVAAVVDPLHVLRAMLGVVRSLAHAKAEQIQIFPIMPHTFDWNRMCFGSQGEGPYSRITWLRHEFNRIPKYMAKGDLATPEELVRYLVQLHTNT